MKRGRDDGEPASTPNDAASSGTGPSPSLRRRTVRGHDHGFPHLPTVVEETEEVIEDVTILLRFPCFDFFRHVQLCEARDGHRRDAATTATEPPTAVITKADTILRQAKSTRFAPEALRFAAGTLNTDAPVAVLNGGTAHEMVFEGQWCEVCGDGTAVTNRAVVHLQNASATASATHRSSSASTLDAAVRQPSPAELTLPVASLLPHTVAGVTADEERRARAEDQHRWSYDRVDVPSAVLVMHRAR